MTLLEKNVVEMSDSELENYVKELRELSTKDEAVTKLIGGKRKQVTSVKPKLTGDLLKILGMT